MKLALLALLCAGTAAICQSPAPPKVDPDRLFQMPQQFAAVSPDLSQPAIFQKFSMNSIHPSLHSEVLRPGPTPSGPKLNNPQIDPKIILHPPWPARRDEPKGQEVARNLYPNLKLLPLRDGAPKPK